MSHGPVCQWPDGSGERLASDRPGSKPSAYQRRAGPGRAFPSVMDLETWAGGPGAHGPALGSRKISRSPRLDDTHAAFPRVTSSVRANGGTCLRCAPSSSGIVSRAALRRSRLHHQTPGPRARGLSTFLADVVWSCGSIDGGCEKAWLRVR
jgi:hypothetical protein